MNKANPIIPWPGGKRRLLKHLLPILSGHPHQCYAEPFAGGAAVLFGRPQPAKVEVLNDIHGELVRLYRVLAHHLDEFMRQLRWSLTSRQMFEWCKMQEPETLTDIQRAARFYYLQKHSFGGKVSCQTFGVGPTTAKGINLLRIEEELSAAHLRLHHVVIEHMDWQACVAKYDRPQTLFLFDPPYWQTEGYGSGFNMDQYEALANVMDNLKGQAILTINNHPDMLQLFGHLKHKTVPINYTIGGGKGVARKEMIYITDGLQLSG